MITSSLFRLTTSGNNHRTEKQENNSTNENVNFFFKNHKTSNEKIKEQESDSFEDICSSADDTRCDGDDNHEHSKNHDHNGLLDTAVEGIHIAGDVIRTMGSTGGLALAAIAGTGLSGLYYAVDGIKDMKEAIKERSVTLGVEASGHLMAAGHSVLEAAHCTAEKIHVTTNAVCHSSHVHNAVEIGHGTAVAIETSDDIAAAGAGAADLAGTAAEAVGTGETVGTAAEVASTAAETSKIGKLLGPAKTALHSPVVHQAAHVLGIGHGAVEIVIGGKKIHDGIKADDNKLILSGVIDAGMGAATIAVILSGSPMTGAALGALFLADLYVDRKVHMENLGKLKDKLENTSGRIKERFPDKTDEFENDCNVMTAS
jgi:hypothetical protein